ncbi:MAG: hypothetical protein Q9162_007426 [Coniocarpon cinnabarinum]
MAAQPTQNRPFSGNGYLPNGPSSGPVPGAQPLLPHQGRVLQQGPTRILCVADVRGHLKSLNDLAKQANADYILHTGDFGFYDEKSLERIAEKTLKHVAQYSPLISEEVRRIVITSPPNSSIKQRVQPSQLPLSELSQFLSGSARFHVPVYTVWGACEDVQVLEKLRSGEYKVPNLHIIDEAHSRLLDVGGVKLRLLGLGGAVVMHKLFDNGEGRTTIAGGQGTMWTTLLQMGELIDTANRVYDPTETRVFVTHASPAREGLLNQLAVTLKVDFSISAGLHFRYGSSYNEFSVNPSLDHYRGKLAASKSSFSDIWETVKSEVEPVVANNESQQRLLQNALFFVDRMPHNATGNGPFGGQNGPATGQVDEAAFKNMWNFNLADAAFGWLVLEVEAGRIGTEMRAQGFNFSHRGTRGAPSIEQQKPAAPVNATSSPLPHGQPRPTPAAAPPAAQQPLQNRQNQPPPQMQQRGRSDQPVPQATHQQEQPKPPAAAAQPPAQTPAAAPMNQNQKPATNVPAATNGVTDKADAPKTNGAAEDSSKEAPSPAPVERKPSQALFVQNVASEDEVKNLFSEADRAKITRVEPKGSYYIVHFESPEEMQKVWEPLGQELKKSAKGKPSVRVFQDRGGRGGFQNFNRQASGTQGTGYRSASDSEGGRGRGGFRGRGRGGARGPRGGGRGGFGNKDGGNAGASGGGSAPSGQQSGGGNAGAS